jgi:HK97 family phage portal protein
MLFAFAPGGHVSLITTIKEAITRPFGAPSSFASDRYLALRAGLDPTRQPDWLVPRTANWLTWDDPAKLSDALRKVTIIFACATYLADAVAESPLRVYEIIDGDKQEATQGFARACRNVLANPNPFMSEAEFMGLVVRVMANCGYGVIEIVRSGANLPLQLWPLRPDWLTKRTNENGERYWDYRIPGQKTRPIDYDDIVIVPYYHDDRFERYGMGPAQVAAREIGIDSSLTDFLKVFLDSGGIPPFVLTHPDPILDDATVTAMQEKWKQKYGGSKAYGSLPILHGGYDIKEIGGSLDEMAWPDLRGLTEQKIAQAFRVPLELVQGYLTFKGGSSLTSSEMDGAMSVLQRYGAAPLRTRIDGALTRAILSQFTGGDSNFELAFDTSEVLALQEDEDKKHTRVRADYDSGIIVLDEARQEIGLQPLANGQGQVFKIPFSTTLTPIGALVESTVKMLPIDGRYRVNGKHGRPEILELTSGHARRYVDLQALLPKQLELRSSALARTKKDRERLTEIGARALRKFWKAQGERIVGAVVGKGIGGPEDRAQRDKVQIANQSNQRILEFRVAEEIDWTDEERQLRLVLGKYYEANGKAAFDAAAELLGIEIDWDLANPNIQRVMATLAKRIVAISDQTRIDVSQIISDSLSEGVTLQELSERLSGLFDETYKGRAMTVARTESMVSYNKATAIGYAESGEIDEIELADNPDHVEDYGATDGLTCAERDGLIVKLSAVDTHIQAEHPNGSLALIPILSTPLGEE